MKQLPSAWREQVTRPPRRIKTNDAVLTIGDVGEGQMICREGMTLVGADPLFVPIFTGENKQGTTLAAGMAAATHSSGTGIVGACAANGTKPAVGLLQEAVANGFAGEVQTSGPMTLADWSAIVGAATLTRGPYYLDPTTPGKLTATAPTAVGQVVQVVGYAVGPATLEINPAPPTLL